MSRSLQRRNSYGPPSGLNKSMASDVPSCFVQTKSSSDLMLLKNLMPTPGLAGTSLKDVLAKIASNMFTAMLFLEQHCRDLFSQ